MSNIKSDKKSGLHLHSRIFFFWKNHRGGVELRTKFLGLEDQCFKESIWKKNCFSANFFRS